MRQDELKSREEWVMQVAYCPFKSMCFMRPSIGTDMLEMELVMQKEGEKRAAGGKR